MHIPPPEVIAAILIVIFFGLGLHEYAHAKVADMCGDPTPSIYGRVTLNLFNHFEPIGTLMIILTTLTGFGIGWGRPVPMDPNKMHNPRWDHFAAVAAGPLSNVAQAIVYGLVLRIMIATNSSLLQMPFLVSLLLYGVVINLALCFFNLIPIGPLDGQWLLGSFLPDKYRWTWNKFNLQVGSILLLVVILMGQMSRSGDNPGLLQRILQPPISAGFKAIVGQPLR